MQVNTYVSFQQTIDNYVCTIEFYNSPFRELSMIGGEGWKWKN